MRIRLLEQCNDFSYLVSSSMCNSQLNSCYIRLNATDMLERLRGKRLVFVGDSLNRNMWESLVCILRNSVKDKRKVFEASGRHEFKTEGSYSFLFTVYILCSSGSTLCMCLFI